MSFASRGLLVAMALAAVCLSVWTRGTEAHALLDHAEPAADSVLKQAPAQLTLYFTQAVVPSTSWVMLRDASGTDTDLKATPDDTKKVMKGSVPASLKPGVYTVRWQTQSADDDDYAQGSYKLTLANADGSVPGSSSGGASKAVIAGGAILAVVVAGGAGLMMSKRKQA